MFHRFFFNLIHLGGTLLISGVGTLALMRLWYPSPYDTITGGLGLFALLITVDVVLGPLLTLVAASPGKATRVLARDLAQRPTGGGDRTARFAQRR